MSIEAGQRTATFQYDPDFVKSAMQLSPVHMPLSSAPYRFPGLPYDAFAGLPGLLADALPDRWGQALVSAWLAARGRDEASFDVVERLCYVGARGMGALEFEPVVGPTITADQDLQVGELVRLANEVLDQRSTFEAELSDQPTEEEMKAILAVGTSAGGARPKAIIAFNEETGQVRSGQLSAGPGFRQWLLKFDGVANSGDHGLRDPQGWGAVEYAYFRMATAAGVTMTECRLLEENGRRHFMTRRFDRPDDGDKVYVQTLAALEHVSYNEPGIYSYERSMLLMRKLGLPVLQIEQQFRRMIFNIVARNQDDHVKNTSLMMGRDGSWTLAPAYDLTFAYVPGNPWLNSHQMSVNNKRDDFTIADLRAVEQLVGLKRGSAKRILAEVTEVVATWRAIADQVGIDADTAQQIATSHRLRLPEG